MFDYIKEKFRPGGIFTKEDIDRYNYLMEVAKISDECKEIARHTVRMGLIDYLPLREKLTLEGYLDINGMYILPSIERSIDISRRFSGTITGRIYSDKPNFTNVSKSK
jgi:hypothetical protein